MDGLINLNKPRGITSAKALYRVRSLCGQRKSGHAGTLDPAADGVLVLCLGRATRLVERIMDQPKVYRATARLDVTSESFDADRPLVPVAVERVPSPGELLTAAAGFEGAIQQVPPQISAVKIGGVPAYKRIARAQPVALVARTVQVYWLHVHAYTWPELDFELACGRGTYIRALIRDLAAALGTGGCLTALTRRRVGPFAVEEGWTFDRIRAASGPAEYVLPLPLAEELLCAAVEAIPPRPVGGGTERGVATPLASRP
ncbi:MAG: tRNA pseudouridine(55) synthase TruB [Planctomycetes bacterium]|nr:tRNA pseudouridine(55) synthase TruB [Planctomycetota bacterium]